MKDNLFNISNKIQRQSFAEEYLTEKYNRKIKIKGLSELKEFKVLD